MTEGRIVFIFIHTRVGCLRHPTKCINERTDAMKGKILMLLVAVLVFSLVFAGDSDQIPVPLTRELPAYPQEARSAGVEGRVILDVVVDANGKVSEAEIAESSGNEALDEAALKAIKKWSFEPGQKDGQEAACRVKIPVEFKLIEEELVEYTELDDELEVLNMVTPDYPRHASKQGTVVISAIIGTDGKVESAEVVDSADDDRLDKAALDAAMLWEFSKPVKDDRSVRTEVLIPFNFKVSVRGSCTGRLEE